MSDQHLQLLHPPWATTDARRVHNGLIDKRRSLIARCRTSAMSRPPLRWVGGRRSRCQFGLGHNVAGRGFVTEGGLMIDLNHSKRSLSTCSGDHSTSQPLTHGLATTGSVVSSTGIAGLTLGGGHGWTRKHGLTVDNLLAAEVVTADGEKLSRPAEEENADLFWALRASGGNFGSGHFLHAEAPSGADRARRPHRVPAGSCEPCR